MELDGIHEPPVKKIAILGLGDLGKRIAFGLAGAKADCSLVIVGREADKCASLAYLISACQGREVTHFCCDGTNLSSILDMLDFVNPDILVQSASLVSPWAAFNRQNSSINAFKSAGFAANLPAQLPIILAVMRAVRHARSHCVVINCSYPDVTNPVLATMGLAPSIGIGNVGMLRRMLALGREHNEPDLRVFAHHSQVWPFLQGQNGKNTLPIKVFLRDEEVTDDINCPLPKFILDKDLNGLAAAHALEVILGLTVEDSITYTSAPGVLGLPGGWPVRIAQSRIELDMPAGTSISDMKSYQNTVSTLEGIREIKCDGTVIFTDELIDRLPKAFKALGAPLHPEEALERSSIIEKLVSYV